MSKAKMFTIYKAGKCFVGQWQPRETPPPLLTVLMDCHNHGARVELEPLHQLGMALLASTAFVGFSACFYDTTLNAIEPMTELHSHEAQWTALCRSELCRDQDPAVRHAYRQVRAHIELGEPQLRSVAAQHSADIHVLPHRLATLGICARVALPCHGVGGKLSVLYLYADTSLDVQSIVHDLPLANMAIVAMHDVFSRRHAQNVRQQWQTLSVRERQVLSLAAEGLPTRKIAEVIEISENTVLKYMKQVFEKLGVKKRQHAISIAMSNHLISPAP